jgi:hypothetical protein
MDAELLRATAITELQSVLLEAPGLHEFVERVVKVAAEQIGRGTAATITLLRNGDLTAVAGSDPRSERCDEVEYSHRDGPCLEAIERQTTVVSEDLSAEWRWPAWRAAATESGFRSVAAVPRRVLDRMDIALNLYGERTNAWDAEALASADVYADEIARALTLALRTSDLRTTNDDLKSALASRAVIDQAIGVIMAQNRCSADDAFGILRSASQHRNIKLRDLAKTIVEGITGRPADDGEPAFVERRA